MEFHHISEEKLHSFKILEALILFSIQKDNHPIGFLVIFFIDRKDETNNLYFCSVNKLFVLCRKNDRTGEKKIRYETNERNLFGGRVFLGNRTLPETN